MEMMGGMRVILPRAEASEDFYVPPDLVRRSLRPQLMDKADPFSLERDLPPPSVQAA